MSVYWLTMREINNSNPKQFKGTLDKLRVPSISIEDREATLMRMLGRVTNLDDALLLIEAAGLDDVVTSKREQKTSS